MQPRTKRFLLHRGFLPPIDPSSIPCARDEFRYVTPAYPSSRVLEHCLKESLIHGFCGQDCSDPSHPPRRMGLGSGRDDESPPTPTRLRPLSHPRVPLCPHRVASRIVDIRRSIPAPGADCAMRRWRQGCGLPPLAFSEGETNGVMPTLLVGISHSECESKTACDLDHGLDAVAQDHVVVKAALRTRQTVVEQSAIG